MTKTWYYEASVLTSVALCMYVLSRQSPAFPPEAEEAVFLRTIEIFLTIFLTLEMALELLTCGAIGFFTDPWHLVDLFVLLTFWLYRLRHINIRTGILN